MGWAGAMMLGTALILLFKIYDWTLELIALVIVSLRKAPGWMAGRKEVSASSAVVRLKEAQDQLAQELGHRVSALLSSPQHSSQP